MTDQYTILTSINARGMKSPHFDAGEAWLRSTLSAVPIGGKWRTRQLLEHIGMANASEPDKKKVSQTLWHLRRSGRVEDCYTLDQSRRYMGNPLVQWIRPQFKEEDF